MRLTRPLRAVVAALTLGLALGAVRADETTEPPSRRQRIELEGRQALQAAIAMARRALAQDEAAESRQMLELVVTAPEFPTLTRDQRLAARFWLGSSLEQLGEWRAAVQQYRLILAERPQLVRVRLELARALFRLGEDEAAEHHFRLALAGELPEPVQGHIEQYLRQIRRRQRWRLDFGLSLVYDSNVNVAPSIRQIEIFGFPFELDDQARATAGAGVASWVTGEYRHRLNASWQWRVGGRLHHTAYENSSFNNTQLGGFTGPRWLFDAGVLGEADLSLLGRVQRHWFGGSGHRWAYGPGLEITVEPTRQLQLHAQLEHLWLDYDNRSDADGTHTALTLRPAYVLSPTASLWLDLGLGRERTRNDRLNHWLYRLGVGYRQDLPHGFTVGLEPSLRYVTYDESWPALGGRRRDRTLQIRTSVLNRRLELGGFTPVLTYRYQRRRSTIDLYQFDQHRVEMGFTRRF